MEDLLKKIAGYSAQYLAHLKTRRVSPSPEALEKLNQFDIPLPENPTDPADVIKQLHEIGSPATIASAGGRYFGFVIGGSLPAALAANWLAGAWDNNAAFSVSSPTGAFIEEVAVEWLIDILKLPKACTGSLVTGTTMANMTSLAAARNYILKKAGWDVESKGLFGAPDVTVIVGKEVHPTLLKALGILGMGRERVITIPVDNQGRMLVSKLSQISGPAIVCTQAGNVNSGAFDSLEEIIETSHNAGAWVHVDCAFGVWANASEKYCHLTKGIEKADSWATDLHKWLNVPYDSGAAFVRHKQSLIEAMSLTATYLPDTDNREPFYFTPETSRRARGVEVWAALKSLGRKGMAEMVERHCEYAKMFAKELSDAGFKILNDVVLNQVLVSFGDKETNSKVVSAIQDDGTCWCGVTEWQGIPAMRISISSWATTEDDIKLCVDAIIKIAKSII
ncbi:pyridoxal phosphate-dependent decarboxylase family protein [Bacteroidota bacterium]